MRLQLCLQEPAAANWQVGVCRADVYAMGCPWKPSSVSIYSLQGRNLSPISGMQGKFNFLGLYACMHAMCAFIANHTLIGRVLVLRDSLESPSLAYF